MPATDQEVAQAHAVWVSERQIVAALQDQRDALISRRTALTSSIQALTAELEAARSRQVSARQSLRDIMNQP